MPLKNSIRAKLKTVHTATTCTVATNGVSAISKNVRPLDPANQQWWGAEAFTPPLRADVMPSDPRRPWNAR
jgi:hypothetical protein